MAIFSFRVFSAQNLLNASGDQAFNINSTNPGNISGTYTTGQENSFFLSVDDTGNGTGNGNNFTGTQANFDDGPSALQELASPATFTYATQNGTIVTTEFPAGSQIQAELQQSFSNGFTIVAIRLENPAGSPPLVTVGYTFIGPPPPPGTVLGTPTSTNTTGDGTVPYASLACFTGGILINTARGLRPVEEIVVGDAVMTYDHGMQPVTWVGKTVVSALDLLRAPNLRPVTVPKGMFGAHRDLQFSRNHRVLVKSPQLDVLSDGSQMLAAIGHFEKTSLPAQITGPVVYYHFACHDHEIVHAEGMLVETILAIPADEEILAAEADTGCERYAARPVLKSWEVRLIDDAALFAPQEPVPA